METIKCLNCDTEKIRKSFVIRTGKVRKVCHQYYDDLANAGKRCCSRCNEIKPLDEIHYNVKNRKAINTGADPVCYSWCRECNKRKGLKWYNANADEVAQKRFDNIEFYREKDQIYYEKVKNTLCKEYLKKIKKGFLKEMLSTGKKIGRMDLKLHEKEEPSLKKKEGLPII